MSFGLNLHRSRVRTHGDAGGATPLNSMEDFLWREEGLDVKFEKKQSIKPPRLSLETVVQPLTQMLRAGTHRAPGHRFGSSCDTLSLRSGWNTCIPVQDAVRNTDFSF